jgi:hypothetical protein
MARWQGGARPLSSRAVRASRGSARSQPAPGSATYTATAVARCRPHQKVCVAGVLEKVSGTHGGTVAGPSLEAVLGDGSGHVTLVWLGRHSIRAVEEGRRIRVQGRLAELQGRRVIYNPDYELLSEQR